MVSVLAFYSDDQSSNPAVANSFFCKIFCEKNEKNKQKEGGTGQLFLKIHWAISIARKTDYCNM